MSGAMYRVLSYLKPRVFLNDSVNSALRTSAVRYFSISQQRNMKLVQFKYKSPAGAGDGLRVGYVEGNNVVDINKADPSLPTTLLAILRNGDLEKVKKLKTSNPPTVPLSSVVLAAPILGMDKVLCIGLNYKDHCEEQNLTPPPVPMIFCKFASTVIGPNDPLKLRTTVTQKVDWEVELVVVIGKKASFVKAADAFNYVLGYTVGQDISARDWQKEKNAGQFLLGKSMDYFCPIGPCIVTGDEIGDPQNLNIKASVNGVQKQNSNTKQLIHKIPDVIERLSSWIVTRDEIGDPENLNIKASVNGIQKQNSDTKQLIHKIPDVIERLSSVMTLLPGDIILTGTPGGVGIYMKPPEYLKPGDILESEIQNIGVLTTRVENF